MTVMLLAAFGCAWLGLLELRSKLPLINIMD